MTGNIEEHRIDIEGTDEYPVLSEEALLRFRMIDDSDPSELDGSLDKLRDALEQAERRWSTLESRLDAQNEAITRLQEALGKQNSSPPDQDEIPELLDLVEPVEQAGVQPISQTEERALLEQIAALESYIAGRADRWRAMEDELTAKARQIDELEQELEQRVVREENLTTRLHDEGDRSRWLRDQLRRVTRRLERIEHQEPK